MAENKIECPRCGHINDPSAVECSKCGVTFSLFFNKTKKPKPKPTAQKATPLKTSVSENLTICPKCGHKVIPPAQECIKCGIIFQKYFEFQERKQKEEQEKAEAEERERLQREKEAAEQAEAEKKERELKEKEAKEKAEAEKRERELKEKETKEKAEAEEREQELKKTQEKIELQKEIEQQDKETLAALQKEIEVLKKVKEENERQELLRKESEEKEKSEARQKEIELQQKFQALTQEAEALKSRNETLEKEEAERKAREEKEKEKAERKAREEKEKEKAIKKEREDQKKRMETILKTLVPQPSFMALLKKYEGEEIGINFDDPAEIKCARLAKVNEDHFSILNMETELLHSYSYNSIVSIVEAVAGVPVEASGQKSTFPMVVRVQHLMVKKKWSFI
jgi:ribosomal protein L40E